MLPKQDVLIANSLFLSAPVRFSVYNISAFQGIADMAGSKDKLRYEILEVSRPESLLIRGKSPVSLTFSKRYSRVPKKRGVRIILEFSNPQTLLRIKKAINFLLRLPFIIGLFSNKNIIESLEALSCDMR